MESFKRGRSPPLLLATLCAIILVSVAADSGDSANLRASSDLEAAKKVPLPPGKTTLPSTTDSDLVLALKTPLPPSASDEFPDESDLPSGSNAQQEPKEVVVPNNHTPNGRSLFNRADDCFLDSMIFPMFAGTDVNDYLVDPAVVDKSSAGKKTRSDLRKVVNEFREGTPTHVEHLRDDIGVRSIGGNTENFAIGHQDGWDGWNYLIDNLTVDPKHYLIRRMDQRLDPKVDHPGHLLPDSRVERSETGSLDVALGDHASIADMVMAASTEDANRLVEEEELAHVRTGDKDALPGVVHSQKVKMYWQPEGETYQLRDQDENAISDPKSIKDGRYHESFYRVDNTAEGKARKLLEKARNEKLKARQAKIAVRKAKAEKERAAAEQVSANQYTESGRNKYQKLKTVKTSASEAMRPYKKTMSKEDRDLWSYVYSDVHARLVNKDKFPPEIAKLAAKVGSVLYFEREGKSLDLGEKERGKSDATAREGTFETARAIAEVAMLGAGNSEAFAKEQLQDWRKDIKKQRSTVDSGDELLKIFGDDYEERALMAKAMRPADLDKPASDEGSVEVSEHSSDGSVPDEVPAVPKKAEYLMKDDETYGTMVVARKKSVITQTPSTLIVHPLAIQDPLTLQYTHRDDVSISSTLDLTDITDPDAATKRWTISGLTLYIGSGGFGHYVSFARYPDGKFYYQNDLSGNVTPWAATAQSYWGGLSKKTKKKCGAHMDAIGSFEDLLDGVNFMKCDPSATIKAREFLSSNLYMVFYSPDPAHVDEAPAKGSNEEGSSAELSAEVSAHSSDELHSAADESSASL